MTHVRTEETPEKGPKWTTIWFKEEAKEEEEGAFKVEVEDEAVDTEGVAVASTNSTGKPR